MQNVRPLFFLIIIFISFPLFSKQVEKFVIGVVNLPPLVEVDDIDRNIKGHLVDYVLKNINSDKIIIELKEIPFKRVLIDMNNGTIDGFLTMVYSDERAQTMRFSSSPLFKEFPVVCHHADTDMKKLIKEKKGLMKIGHLEHTVVPKDILNLTKDFFYVSGNDFLLRLVKMLSSKRVDLIYHPLGKALQTIVDSSEYKNMIHCKKKGVEYSFHLAVCKKSDEHRFKLLDAQISKAIQQHPFIF